ncbi:MAG: ComEC family competence protein [Acidobacteria bacterium]|nr:ComEC family competence protein [Acidobacteriota bacterium]
MSSPALVPALALAAGCALGLAIAASPLVLAGLIGLAWLAALGAFAAHRPGLFLASAAASYCLSGWGLAAAADRDARHPPLLEAWRGAEPGERLVLEGVLREDAATWEDAVGLSLAVDHLGDGPSRAPTSGGVRLAVSGALAAGRAGGWRAGRRVRLAAALREPAHYRDPGVRDARTLSARRGTILAGSVKSAALVETLGRGSLADEAAASLRDRTRQSVRRRVGTRSPRSAAIIVAILIGDRAGLDQQVERRLQEAGTYHVIAISGGNIAILAALAVFALRLLGLRRRGVSLAVIALLAAYAFVVGAEPSVMRATAMASIYLAARLADFRSGPLNALAASAALILAALPCSAGEVGFALTYGATLGILIGARAFAAAQRAPWWARAPLGLLLASASAELALIPVSAWAFSRVTFAGLVLNFAAIPLMTAAQVSGMAVVPLDAWWPGAASAAGLAAHLAAEGLVRSAGLLDLASWLSYRLPPPHPAAIAGYYLAWVAWLAAARPGRGGRRARVVRRLAVPLGACSLAWILVEPRTLLWPGVAGRLRVAVLDVGHADAILVQLPDRRSILVDAGGSLTGGSFDVGGRVVAPALWALGTRRLDALVLTHGDPDHAGGAASAIRDFRPREVWEGIPVPGAALLHAVRREAEAAGARWRTIAAGDRLDLGGVSLAVWHPPAPEWERQRVRNDDSLVLELRYRDASIVLPGDIGGGVERELAPRVRPAALRVLKVPHHGSASSSTAEFLEALAPQVAILSAGPGTRVSEAALQRYAERGVRLFRTDRDGAITLTTDGHALTVETSTGERTTITTSSTTGARGWGLGAGG